MWKNLSLIHLTFLFNLWSFSNNEGFTRGLSSEAELELYDLDADGELDIDLTQEILMD